MGRLIDQPVTPHQVRSREGFQRSAIRIEVRRRILHSFERAPAHQIELQQPVKTTQLLIAAYAIRG
jgi:hypothetical protein